MTTGRANELRTGAAATGAQVTRRPLPRDVVKAHREQIVSTLARHHMRNPQVFGSVAKATDTSASDLDLLVDADADLDLLDLVDAAEELESLLGVHVDIVTSRSVDGAHEIIRTAVPV